MPTTIVMPQLGESVAEGIIGKWLKAEGDRIDHDEALVEIITDKVTAEIPSPVGGIVRRIAQPEGATVAVGQEIAVIGDENDDIDTTRETAGSAAATASSGGGPTNGSVPEAGDRGSVALAERVAVAPAGSNRADRVRSSPLVRRLAEEHGVNLTDVPGTGIGGRVSKQDILRFVDQMHLQSAPQPATPAPAVAQPASSPSFVPPVAAAGDESIVLSPIRKIIAERMLLSKTTIPHAVTIVEVDMTKVVRYREAKKEEFRAREGSPLSYVAFVVKATVDALMRYPDVNSEWGGDSILRKRAININVAVDAPDGLITPVIHGADGRSLAGLSLAVADLASRARARKLAVQDMQGGTFTVNNTGALGSVWSMSIIPPPQCGILAAAAIVKRPVVIEHDGQDLVAVRHMMNLTLSFDHRILDGGYASGFLNSIKQTLESWSADYPLY